MNFLGTDFIISSILWLIIVFSFMFFFRKKIFRFIYKQTDFDKFLLILKNHLKETYPQIEFDFSYLDSIKNEPNPDVKKYGLIDNIINQYFDLQLSIKKLPTTPTNQLWSSYAFNSKPNKNKLPEDWLQRKSVLFQRDNKTCQRCFKKLNSKDADIFMIKPLDQNGQYYFENLILLCQDCTKIENHKRDKTTNIKYLNIKEELYSLVK